MTTQLQQKTTGENGWNSLIQKMKPQLEMALPKHLNADRMIRIMMTQLRTVKDLSICTKESVLGSLIQAAQLGLEPGSALGHAYLVPFNNKKMNRKECQLQIGYRGMIDLARRSGQVISLTAQCVFENDEFVFSYGLEEKLEHSPSMGERGRFVCAYAIAKLNGGGYQFDVMSKEDIDKIRARSQAANSSYSPWSTDYFEMARKTVIKRLFKYLPVSIEMANALDIDNKSEYDSNENQVHNDVIYDVSEFTESVADAQPAPMLGDISDDLVNRIFHAESLEELDNIKLDIMSNKKALSKDKLDEIQDILKDKVAELKTIQEEEK